MEEFNGNGKRIALVCPYYPEAIMQNKFPPWIMLFSRNVAKIWLFGSDL